MVHFGLHSKVFFGKKHLEEVNVRGHHSTQCKNQKCIRDGVIAKRPKRDRKVQQKSELDRRLLSICTKLDESKVKAGIKMAVGDFFFNSEVFFNSRILQSGILQTGPNQFVENKKNKIIRDQDNTGRFGIKKLPKRLEFFLCRNVFAETSSSRLNQGS